MRQGGSVLRIVSWGSGVSGERFFCEQNHGKMPYPVGYTIERNVFAVATDKGRVDRTKVLFPNDTAAAAVNTHLYDVYYTASIRQGPNDDLVFEVTRSDRPDIVYSADNPSAPWRSAFEAAERDFPTRMEELVTERRDANGVLLLRGQKWFGLTYDSVLSELKKVFGLNSLDTLDGSSSLSLVEEKRERLSSSASFSSSNGGASCVAKKQRNAKQRKGLNEKSQEKSLSSEGVAPVKKQRGSKKDSGIHGKEIIIEEDDLPLSVLVAERISGIVRPCKDCGLTTAYCPFTGKMHGFGEESRHNNVLTNGTRAAKLHQPTQEVGKGVNTSTEGVSKRRGGKRISDGEKKNRVKNVVGGENEEMGKNGAGKATIRKKAKKELKEKKNVTGLKQQKLLYNLLPKGDGSACQDGDDVPFVTRFATSILAASNTVAKQKKRTTKSQSASSSSSSLPSPSPPVQVFRPPLEDAESQKALKVLQHLIRAEKNICVPFASSLNLPLLPATKSRAGKKRCKDDAIAEMPGDDSENIFEESGPSVITTTDGGKADEKAKDRHPLDISDLATSLAGRRYVKFIQQYTSEKAKLDLLKKADILQASSRSVNRLDKGLNKNNGPFFSATKKEEGVA